MLSRYRSDIGLPPDPSRRWPEPADYATRHPVAGHTPAVKTMARHLDPVTTFSAAKGGREGVNGGGFQQVGCPGHP